MFEGPAVERAQYEPEALALLDVFQYLIGNTDWSAFAGPRGEDCCHNVVPYVRADGTFVPVAYDFDASGIVNPPHAAPDQRLPIRNVRQRLYRGRCRAPPPALAFPQGPESGGRRPFPRACRARADLRPLRAAKVFDRCVVRREPRARRRSRGARARIRRGFFRRARRRGAPSEGVFRRLRQLI